ncbi:MAG: hypothetical protein E7256_07015 [Lachnospiraceae bacterium]|nr:hypothetical protein [Lachnospiraceae bacterium]
MKKRRVAAVIMAAMMLFGGISGGTTVPVYASETQTAYLKVNGGSKIIDAKPGEVTHVKIPVIAMKDYIVSPSILAVPADKAPFTVSDVTLTKDNYTDNIQGISNLDTTYLEFDLDMKDSAKIGTYDLTLNISFISTSIDDFDYNTNQYSTINTTLSLTVRVKEEKAPIQIAVNNVSYNEDAATVGDTFNLSFTAKNEGQIAALNTYVSIDYTDTGMAPGYSVESMKLGDLGAGEGVSKEVPIKVLSTATEGLKKLTATFTYKDSEGNEGTATKAFYVNIKKTSTEVSDNAKLTVSTSARSDEVDPGTAYELKATIANIGKAVAKDIKVTLAGGVGVDSGVLPNFSTDSITIGNLKKGESNVVSIPLLVSKTAAKGLKEITINVTYTDEEKTERTATAKAYLTVLGTEEEPEVKNEIEISGASQSPSSPSVGDTVTVSFTITNRGTKAASSLKVFGKELSSDGFEPLDSMASKTIGTLDAGESKQVSMQFRVGNGIPEGLNALKIGYSYMDVKGAAQEGDATIYILDVQNDSNSKPKLIVTDFSADKEELRAGDTFDFTFALKNTHMSKSAKNIKVTITQKDSVFSATKGSNSFFIDRISAGETVENTINMKVKADAATGAYEVEIAVEYEYDDMSKTDQEAGGVKDTNVIKLQAVENARPVIENISIGNWDAPMVNQSTSMSFEFYNMGKSTLNNVYFTFEGDFTLETGEMYYLGPVTAGGYEIVEPMVIPNVSGNAGGTILIHFEDSNGDETIVRKEFSDILVNEEYVPDFSGMDDMPVDNGNVQNAKENIVSLPVFLLIQAVILAVFVPVSRKIVITRYKNKLRKEDENA